jgi:hypothetical protein
MSMREVKLLDLNDRVFEEKVQVPSSRGVGNKVPSLVSMGERTFEWDAKAGVYRQIQVYAIPLPDLKGM